MLIHRLTRLAPDRPSATGAAREAADRGKGPGATPTARQAAAAKPDGFNVPLPRGSEMKPIAASGMRRAAFLAALPLAFALNAMTATGAAADFRVCNATQGLVGVAIGYRAQAGWVTEGWWHVEGSTCKTLIEGPLASRYYYLYAEDAERGGRWEGSVSMCVAEREFKIAGPGDCFARGFQRAGFQEYDTGEQSSWMVQLTDDVPAAGSPTVSGAPALPTVTGGTGTR
jgi:uncharacterized membrane protein